MSEDLLEITDSISIDETPGVQADKDEIAVEEDWAAQLAALFPGYDFGKPANLSHKEGMISTPDGFSTIGWAADEEGTSLDGVESNLMALDPESGEYEAVTLSTEDDGKVLIGTTASGNIAFIAVIVPSEDGLSSDVYLLGYLPMEHGDSSDPDDFVELAGLYVHVTVEGSLDFEFDGAPSGNNDFMAFGEADGVAIVVTGRTEGETVNSSKAGNEPTSLAANSNNINAGEGLVITYVLGMNPDYLVPNLSGPEASDTANILFDDLHSATEGSVTIVKVGPGNTTATVKITALYTEVELGADFIPGITNDGVITITAVYVNGEVAASTTDSNGAVTVTGIRNNDVITFETDGDHNRFVVENGGTGNARFSLGGVSIAGTEEQSDAALASLLFYDDGPSVGDNLTVELDDGALEGGNKEDFEPVNTTGTLAHDFGADGAGSIEWLTTGAPAGFSYVLDGDDLQIKQDDVVVLTLTVDADGNYTVTQNSPVMHAPGDGENTQTFSIGYRVTDKDGDSIDGSLMIDVVDDVPTIALSGDTVDPLETDDSDIIDSDSADFSVLFDVSFGADGPADGGGLSYSLSVLNASSGLVDTLTGQAVMLALDEDGDIVGSIMVEGDAVEVIRISVDTESGEVTLTQSRALVHPGVNDPNDQVTLASGTIGLTATAMDADGDEVNSDPVDISGAFVFLDDEPEFERDIEDGSVAFLVGQTDTDSGFLDYGNDGAKSFVITDYTELPNDTILGEVTAVLSADGTELVYSNADGELFRLTLDSVNSYLFEVLQDAPLILNPLDFGSVTPGGPKELEIVQGELGTTTVVFDGFLSTNFDGDAVEEYDQGNLPDPGDTADDVNISSKGIGLKDNQMDPGEQLKFSVYEDFTAGITKEVEGVQLVIDGGTGPNTTFSVRMVAYDSDGNLVAEEVFEGLALPKGSNTLVLDFLPGESFHEVYLFHDLDNDNNGFRIKSISLYEREEIPDFQLETTVRATDGDGDFVEGSFTIDIGGSGESEMSMEDSLL
ncbi:DUF5801 repeats-in-toxin domain-containing protein [Halomonas sp. 328]|uniref:DUF5801 repeats-in-toxin domain-containing protein n=1 Tax=Halomonas sp. 328 TaxID=2776704 RepID=UPI0018A71023|nr:DUF5801 repeats-in-toxin domain-containing protein [Halomonas sp. 328]MBF8221406.1 hypothetical protein [Halomonas sp. 328]